MDNIIISIKSNIKAIGWVVITIFSLILLLSSYNLINQIIMYYYSVTLEVGSTGEHFLKDYHDLFSLITMSYIISFALSIFVIIAGKALIKYKIWSVYIIHAISIIIVIAILIGIVHLSLQFHNQGIDNSISHIDKSAVNFINVMAKFHTISIGSFGLIIAWVITKVNLLLISKKYRKQLN